MTEILPYIFGAIALFGGIYAFVISFKIYKPKTETEEQKIRIERFHKRMGPIMKVLSVFLIIYGAYSLFFPNPDRFRVESGNDIQPVPNSEWTQENKEALINGCIRESGITAMNHPALIDEYCKCSINKIASTLDFDEYQETLQLPLESKQRRINSIIESCRIVLEEEISKTEENK
jgi:hypothetical protein